MKIFEFLSSFNIKFIVLKAMARQFMALLTD